MSTVSGVTSQKGIDLDELQQEAEKLLGLLKDRQPGLMTWNDFMCTRLKNLNALISRALDLELPKAFLVGTHRYSFRAGKPAEILGIVFLNPRNCNFRVCYHVRFDDGHEDDIPITDTDNFEIISEDDVVAGRIPKVVN